MVPVGVLRKNFTFGKGTETLGTWVATNRDLEVTLVKGLGVFSVFSFITHPQNSKGFEGEDNDLLIQVECFESEDLREAEEHFKSYTSSFL